MKGRIILLAALAGFLSTTLPAGLVAQESTRAAKAVVAEPEEAIRDAREVKRQVLKVRKVESAAASGSIAAPDGGTLDYTCASGNCSCAGAKDCVNMKKICAPKTMSCNDYGCTCAENPDSGDDGG